MDQEEGVKVEQKPTRQRLSVLELAEEAPSSVSEACKRRYSRTQFYECKRRFKMHGMGAPRPVPGAQECLYDHFRGWPDPVCCTSRYESGLADSSSFLSSSLHKSVDALYAVVDVHEGAGLPPVSPDLDLASVGD